MQNRPQGLFIKAGGLYAQTILYEENDSMKKKMTVLVLMTLVAALAVCAAADLGAQEAAEQTA